MERVRALTDQLEAGITGLFQSGQYAAYLQSLSKLHHYSYGNIFLIKLQCPHASMVAGYGDWKRKFGRHVKAGETGITILAPCPYWARDEVEETGPDGQTIKEQKWVKKTGFTTATVFDVSQTEGRELPSLGVESLTGTVEGYEKLLSTLKSISPVPVSEGPLPPGVHGAYYHAEQKIIVTITESMDERFPTGKQMSLSQAENYVRQVDQEYREAERTPQAVKVKIDYVKDGRTDRYWLPLEIGAGGSLLEQMQTHIGAYQDGQARVNQLFQSVPQEYRTVLQEELTPFIHQSVDELSRGLLPCFQRHCQAADLGKQMEEQAALLPEGEQEAFRSAVQQIMKRLHKSINMGKTQEQPAVQREAPSAEGLLSPQEDMTQPPQEREAGPAPCSPSVKVRLQQLRKDRRPAPAVTQVEMAPPEPGRPAKSEYDARRMQWEVQERAIPKPKARRPKPRKGPER